MLLLKMLYCGIAIIFKLIKLIIIGSITFLSALIIYLLIILKKIKKLC